MKRGYEIYVIDPIGPLANFKLHRTCITLAKTLDDAKKLVRSGETVLIVPAEKKTK